MDKRGEENLMLKNIIEILLAIIVIVMIISAGVVLFNTYFGKQKDMQAKGTANEIVQNLAKANETGKSSKMFLENPSGWYIVSFDASHDKNNDFEKPSDFFGKNTLCICEKGRIKKSCYPEICRQISMPLMKEGNPAFIKIGFKDLYFTNMKDYFEVSDKVIEITEPTDEEKIEFASTTADIEEKYSSINEIAAKHYPDVKGYFNDADDLKKFIEAIIDVESGGDPDIKSECGAAGMMQLMPDTAKKDLSMNVPDYALVCSGNCEGNYKGCSHAFECNRVTPEKCRETEDERFDALKNIDAGTRYIIGLINKFKDIQLALAAYNAGQGNVQEDCGSLADITSCPVNYPGRIYAGKVMGRYNS